jgi:hypothetical protein
MQAYPSSTRRLSSGVVPLLLPCLPSTLALMIALILTSCGGSGGSAPKTTPQSQTISFGAIPAQTIGTPLTLSATASSGLAVSFASTTSTVCTVSGTTASFVAAGTCAIQATQAGNSSYAAATPISQGFTVNAASLIAQTITFGTIPTQKAGNQMALSAAASSGLPVSFASTTSTVCTVSGTTASFIAAGTCTIQATQGGNSSYAAATPVSQSLTVSINAQTITFDKIPPKTVGTLLALSATASSGLAVSFASTTSTVCTVSGTTASFIAAGTCTIQATQAGDSTYAAATPVSQTFTVNGEAQTITFGTIPTQMVGKPLALSAAASSGLPVSFASTTSTVCTVSGTTASFIAAGTCTIQATQGGNSSYAAATPVSQSLTVSINAQTITFDKIPPKTVGTLLALSATASSGLAVSFASTTSTVCTVSGTTASFIAAGTCTIQATQAGDSTYAAATPVSQTFTVNGEAQTITFGTISDQTYGTPLMLSATASSGLPVSFSVVYGPGIVSGANDSKLTFTGLGTVVVAANQAGNSDYKAAAQVQQTLTVVAVSDAPATADVLLSQVNWLLAFPNGGALYGQEGAGTSFAVNSDGNVLLSTNWGNSVLLINGETGTLITLGSYVDVGPVTIDSNNDLYVASPFYNVVVKVPYNSGAYATVSEPFVAETTSIALPACTGSSTTECVFAWNSAGNDSYLDSSAYGSNFGIASMAFNASGDLFYAVIDAADFVPVAIFDCNVTCLAGTGGPVMVYQEPHSATDFQVGVGSMAFDPSGNLFFTDSALNSNGQRESEYSDLNELPVSTEAGYGGVMTGFAATPTDLYTLAPSTPTMYNDALDGVAIASNGTVYFTTANDGIFAMEENAGTVDPASLYTVATQGAELLTLAANGKLYGASWVITNIADTLFSATVNNAMLPEATAGTPVTNSTALNPVSVILNDGQCTTPETVTFNTLTDFSAALIAGDACVSTMSGGSAFPATITFTPSAPGSFSEKLTTTDSDGKSGTATLTGVGLP